MATSLVRHDWTLDQIREIYQRPFLELMYQAATLHRQYHDPAKVQVCHLISVKTGGCPENCKYCAQSARYQTYVEATPLMDIDEVIARARVAKEKGATRICLGAAWRDVRDSKQFERVLEMVREVKSLGVQVCCTLGMLKPPEAKKLADAGVYAYNHNLDTSREFYPQIVTTRTYEERLNTLDAVEEAGISVCCGGIVGMGESEEDRLKLLQQLANRAKHPDSLPINRLTPIEGTPLGGKTAIPFWQFARLIATARHVFPLAMIRLSCARITMTKLEQGMCFLAGANSIHSGEKLLTVSNPDFAADTEMFSLLGLKAFSLEEI